MGIECSPGTFVYWDKGYGDGFPDQPFSPAALVVTRVISLRGIAAFVWIWGISR
ncbi:hypothetical protein ACQ86N_27335 [Puia sp. P3]|uniref:hypothetical protein n=1 Tax=Puia sp. P3 TaxID=3423952 RepID=UPI003D66E28D